MCVNTCIRFDSQVIAMLVLKNHIYTHCIVQTTHTHITVLMDVLEISIIMLVTEKARKSTVYFCVHLYTCYKYTWLHVVL